MSAPLRPERCTWREYRGSEHAWSPVPALGMQRSRCGYLARDARLSQASGRRCMVCVCIVDENFGILPRDRVSASIARLQDIRRTYDHVRRAKLLLTAATLDPALCRAALDKLSAVEGDLIEAFRLERAGTRNTADDASLGEADGVQAARTV